MSILQKIIDQIIVDESEAFTHFDNNPPSTKEVKAGRKPYPLNIGHPHPFFIITEVKKASPSKGLINSVFDPISIAKSYVEGGASAISVITEKNFFQGAKEHLRQVRLVTDLPILRKDFIIHPAQVYESYQVGADIVLLIAAALNDERMKILYQYIIKLGMTPLVEIHNEIELKRALDLSPLMIGINNRNLKTFEVDLNTSLKLKKNIPSDISVISESGIKNHEDIKLLKKHNFVGALIGESLLRSNNLAMEVKKLKEG